VNSNSSVGFFIAMVGLFVASRLPDSPFSSLVRYLAVGYIVVHFILRARSGYRRRRPHWMRDSWRRFLIACSVPTSALVVFVCMLAALAKRQGIPRDSLHIVGHGQMQPANRTDPGPRWPWQRYIGMIRSYCGES
jgi:hypothetical protein